MDPDSDGMDSMHLWIIIGCIGGSLVIILLVTMVAVVCCFCTSRCRPASRKQLSGSPNSKRMHKGLKPPDLWIHGNVELSEMEHIDPDDISEVESATIGHRRMRSTNDKGGRDDDRYCSASLRHVPLVIPVDTPPTYREPVVDPISLAYHSRSSSTGNTTFPSRSQYAATPRVNIADIALSNPDREMTSGSSSFKVLPSNSTTSPQVCLPLLASDEQLIDNPLDFNSSDLPNCISTEELTEEMANIEGLMKDLNNITRLHFSY